MGRLGRDVKICSLEGRSVDFPSTHDQAQRFANEVVGAALEGQVLLTDAVHLWPAHHDHEAPCPGSLFDNDLLESGLTELANHGWRCHSVLPTV